MPDVTIPEPGQHWIDLRPMTDRKEWRDSTKFRRCIDVVKFEANGWAEGYSYWEKHYADGWREMNYPGRRWTRILAHVFERRFIRKEP